MIVPWISNDKKNKNEKSKLVDISVQLGINCFLFQGIEIDFLKAVVILTDFYLNITFELNFMKTCRMWLIRAQLELKLVLNSFDEEHNSACRKQTNIAGKMFYTRINFIY